jgi:hypothetical protein
MAASAAQVRQLRRMTAEPAEATYTDEDLASYIEAHPLMDANGREQYSSYGRGSTTAPTVNAAWIPTYDLNAAAGDIWAEKAAALAANFDHQADGATISLSQPYEHALAQARYWRSRRRPLTARQESHPRRPGDEDRAWIGNLPEPAE